jgi:esterase/lipase superfamily enzyme
LQQLALAAVLLVPAAVRAQSTDLLLAYKNFEAAKAADKVSDALKFGNTALKLTEEGGDKQGLTELLLNLGDYAAQANQDGAAAEYYGRALALQESALGSQNPDLAPTLTALAKLHVKAKRYADAAALELRVLDIERQAYGEHHENVSATLTRLREIYRLAGDSAGVARMDAQLLQAATVQRALPKTRRYKQNQGFATVRVFYGTNRAATGDLKPAEYYGKARGDLQYGYLDVTIPQLHKEAELETQPRWTEYVVDASEARRRYVLLEKITPLAKDAFLRELQLQVKAAPSKDVFIFVHGFNNTFEDAARRAAQLTYDLDFDGTPLLYSWPSQGSATAYAVDEAAVGISGRKMAEFLEAVVTQSGAAHVHILAHSMGNRALLEALQTYLAKRAPENRQHLFGQIVFTAPDVDRDYFMDAIEPLRNAADRVTLYASSNDYALRSSQFLHGAPRAGTAGDVIIRLAGIDTIDMSAVPADSLGHSYFAANAGAIFDIFRLLWRGDPPPQRCGMSDRKAGGPLAVWVFNADACKGVDLLEAGVMLKRFGDLARARVIENMSTLTDPSEKQEWSLVLKRLDGLLGPGGLQLGAPAK